MEFTDRQKKLARQAKNALWNLEKTGLKMVWHASGDTLYAVDHDTYCNLEDNPFWTDKALECGIVHDGGDF